MREYLNTDTLFNTIAMLRSGTDGLIVVVEGADDRHAIERHLHDSVSVLSGQGGKQELLEAAALVDERNVLHVRILLDRDYDNQMSPAQPYADCIVSSTHHDVVMDLVLADRAVIYRVIGAHTRGVSATSRPRAEKVFGEALEVASKVSLLRMLSVERGWELNMADFPFGRFDEIRPNPQNVVKVALGRSKPGPKPTPVLRLLRSTLKAAAGETLGLVGDHDFFGALAYILRGCGFTSVKDAALASSFFAAVDCPSLMKTDWYREITSWSMDSANVPSFACPCEFAA